MKKLILILLLLPIISFSQVIMSWNIQNLGESKYKKKDVVENISYVILESKADIIAIQEVVLSQYGDSCISKISKILDFDYVISPKTTGSGSERYAYLFRKDIMLNKSYLDSSLSTKIDREPYIAIFTYNCRKIIIRQVHLVPTTKHPENEIVELYKYTDGIICGDFNLTSSNIIYIPLLKYFQCPLGTEPSTLKTDGSISLNSYDHFLVDKKIKVNYSMVFSYGYTGDRRLLSDHLPIIIVL